jgi:hypothetical protein
MTQVTDFPELLLRVCVGKVLGTASSLSLPIRRDRRPRCQGRNARLMSIDSGFRFTRHGGEGKEALASTEQETEFPTMKQRDKMRGLFRRFSGKEESVVAEYAAAEEAGEVVRKKNLRGLSSRDYAERLFLDGVAKGWITDR